MKKNISFLSSFNIQNLHNYLISNLEKDIYSIKKPEFGSFYDIAFKNIKIKKNDYLCVVWTQIEYLVRGFNKLIFYQNI